MAHRAAKRSPQTLSSFWYIIYTLVKCFATVVKLAIGLGTRLQDINIYYHIWLMIPDLMNVVILYRPILQLGIATNDDS